MARWHRAVSSKGRVLVLDDACLVADTLAQIFLNSGYEARAVYAAEAALELLESDEWIPALAIIDVQLPGMNGIKSAIILKAKYPDMRLRLFSGHALTADRIEEARQKGHLFEVIAKPTHPTVFLDLASLLTNTRLTGSFPPYAAIFHLWCVISLGLKCQRWRLPATTWYVFISS